MVFAFLIDTDVEQAIQYIRETFYTESWGQGGATLIHIWSWVNKDDIWLNGQVEANRYCDRNWENCRESENIITWNNITNWNVPKILWRNLQQSNIYDSGWIVMIWESDPVNASIPWIIFYINGNSFFNWDLTWNNWIYSDDFIYSSWWYCDYDGNCQQITDFYTTWQSDDRYYTSWYINDHFYTKTYITGNYYDKTEIDTTLLNYFTTWYISWHFQDDIDSTICIYWFSWVADDGTVSCATNNDTNFYPTWMNFNSSNWVLTIQMSWTSNISENLDWRYITWYTETDPIWNSVSWNYFTTWYISWHFQDDIDSTICIYWFSWVADNWTVSCAVNNNTDNQSLSYNSATDEISLINWWTIDITEVDTNFYATWIDFDITDWDLTIQMSWTSDITKNLDWRYLTNTNTILENSNTETPWWVCANTWRIIFDATNKNFLGCDWATRLKLNN